MDALQEFAQHWDAYLKQDAVLNKRNKHLQSTITDGRAVVELCVQGKAVFTVSLKGGHFQLRSGKADSPLLSWSVPIALFKEVLLGKERILYALLDRTCTLTFDSPAFTHWNGITALGVILAAQEMVRNNAALKRLVEGI
jgi:hypothetical protein